MPKILVFHVPHSDPRSNVTLVKYCLRKVSGKKHGTKFSKPSETANNHPLVVLETYILEASINKFLGSLTAYEIHYF